LFLIARPANRYRLFSTLTPSRELHVTRQEIAKLQNYMRGLFRLDSIHLHARAQKDDSVEVNVGDEFIGIIFRDEDEGELSYAFNMTILDIDLPED